jgi:hypothetical protein
VNTYSNYFYTLIRELLCSRLGSIASDTADLELVQNPTVVEECLDNGTTLVASSTEHCDDLGHAESWTQEVL